MQLRLVCPNSSACTLICAVVSLESARAIVRSNVRTLISKQPRTAVCDRARLRRPGRDELSTSSSTLSWATTSHPRASARALASHCQLVKWLICSSMQ